MACQDMDYERRTAARPFDRLVRTIVDALLPALRQRAAPLDVDALPDHLKRDLGFLDGRSSYCGRDY
ncbi:hypothetical protein [Mycoplana dimorpha]|uniref:Uncharacterized protein n=1 Tax=Mycoplana dimorpha TaxID=28320 RepID=A0A2T5B169_MYCDI|nr:hypothetical protein [Mycoplana dimorpha]PTM92732.1 hypothetical protein C7449_107145 [Mycoplana dimorpha]